MNWPGVVVPAVVPEQVTLVVGVGAVQKPPVGRRARQSRRGSELGMGGKGRGGSSC